MVGVSEDSFECVRLARYPSSTLIIDLRCETGAALNSICLDKLNVRGAPYNAFNTELG